MPLLRTEKIHKFYSQMDVFLFLAKNEAMPNTIIELLCYGTSIITTDSGSIKDIVDNNKGGFIVNRKDEELIIKKIKELKSNDVRQSFSNHNVNKFKNNFSEDIAIIHFKKLYKEVIDA